MVRVGVGVAWLLSVRPAETDEEPVVVDTVVMVSVLSMVGRLD